MSTNAQINDVRITRLVLNGERVDVRIEQAITSASIERTMEGASTLTLTVHDPQLALLQSGIFNRRVLASIDRFSFWLVKVSKQGNQLTLTFEDTQVARLRIPNRPRKAVRGKVTRAQFALSLIRELKAPRIPYVIPELNIRQPVGVTPARTSASERSTNREPGIDANAPITVKGVRATAEQRSNIERVLDVGRKRNAPRKVLVSAVVTITEESVARNLTGGDRDSVGLFQQRASQGWPATRNIETDADAYYDKAINVNFHMPSIPVYELAHRVQLNFDTATKGRISYGRWVAEAEKTVAEYLGGTGSPQQPSSGSNQGGRYEFSRGEPGRRESTWDALQRLASEVRWRCFVSEGRLYFVSEDYLFKAKPSLRINPDTDGILGVDFDWDMGKPVNGASLTARADRWAVDPGMVVVLEGYGVANGRYLVLNVRRNLFSPDTSIELIKRTPQLPEPAAETISADTSISDSLSDAGQSAVDISRIVYASARPIDGGSGGNWAGAKEVAEEFAALVSPPCRVSSTKRSRVTTAAGNVSDHYEGNSTAYALDCACSLATGDSVIGKLGAALGVENFRGGRTLNVNVTRNGRRYRVQVLWRVPDHYDHIHIGAKAL
jgi:hypothetical protein